MAESTQPERQPERQPAHPHDAPVTEPNPSGSPLTQCPHCDAPLTGRYCAQCGQDNRHERLNARTLFGDFFESITDLDWPILRTIIDLSIRPGQTCRDYVRGHRKKYTNPLRYCFLVAAIMVLVTLMTGTSVSDGMRSLMGTPAPDTLPADTDPETREQLEKVYEAVDMFERNMHYLTLATFPLMTLALMLLFRKMQYGFAEHAVFYLYVTGHMFFIMIVTLPTGVLATSTGAIGFQVVTFCYQIWTARTFYRVGVWAAGWRIALLFLANVIVNGTVGAVGGILYTLLA